MCNTARPKRWLYVLLALVPCGLCVASPGFIEGEILREAFGPDGTTLLTVRSECRIQRDGQSWLLEWRDENASRQIYYITPTGQVGSLIVRTTAGQSLKLLNVIDASTNQVVALDNQPRNASPELRVLGLALLDRDNMDLALGRGFVVPWGPEEECDAACSTPVVQYGSSGSPLLKTLDFVWDSGKYKRAMSRWGPASNRILPPAIQNGWLQARLRVLGYTNNTNALPESLVFERFWALQTTNASYLVERIKFTATNSGVAAHNLNPLVPSPDVPTFDFAWSTIDARGVFRPPTIGSSSNPIFEEKLRMELIAANEARMYAYFGGNREVKHLRLLIWVLLVLPIFYFAFLGIQRSRISKSNN